MKYSRELQVICMGRRGRTTPASSTFYLRIFPQRVSKKEDNKAFPELLGGDYLLSPK